MLMRLVTGLAIAVLNLSCGSITSTARGISVQLQASPLTAVTDDTVTFLVTVAATNVSSIVINFADGNDEQYTAGGLPTAVATFKHVYANVGNYLVRATVSDAVSGNRVVTQLIVVNQRSDSTGDAQRRR